MSTTRTPRPIARVGRQQCLAAGVGSGGVQHDLQLRGRISTGCRGWTLRAGTELRCRRRRRAVLADRPQARGHPSTGCRRPPRRRIEPHSRREARLDTAAQNGRGPARSWKLALCRDRIVGLSGAWSTARSPDAIHAEGVGAEGGFRRDEGGGGALDPYAYAAVDSQRGIAPASIGVPFVSPTGPIMLHVLALRRGRAPGGSVVRSWPE